MNANDNEAERRRVIAQLQKVVRNRHVASEYGKDHEAKFPLCAKRTDAPAGPVNLSSGQGSLKKAVPDGWVPRPTPPLHGRDSEMKGFGPPGRGREMAPAYILAEGAEMAPAPGASRSDAMHDRRNFDGELGDLLCNHEEEFPTPVAVSADVRSRRYLLGAAAVTIILGLAGLAASFTFHGSSPSVGETARVAEVETPELEQEDAQTEAAPQDASAAEAQQSSALLNKVEDTSEASHPSENGPAASEDRGSATTEAYNLGTASPRLQVQDPLAAAPLAQPIKSLNAPALPTGAFSAQEPPQAPAAEPTKETPGGPGKSAHARDETSVESLTASPQLPPKTAPLPRRRAVTASAERSRGKAAEGKQKEGAPPQETLSTNGGAEANPPSDVVQRALDSLFKGWERTP